MDKPRIRFAEVVFKFQRGTATNEDLDSFEENRRTYKDLWVFCLLAESVTKGNVLLGKDREFYLGHREYGKFLPVQGVVLEKFRDEYGAAYVKIRLVGSLDLEFAKAPEEIWVEIAEGQELDWDGMERLLGRNWMGL